MQFRPRLLHLFRTNIHPRELRHRPAEGPLLPRRKIQQLHGVEHGRQRRRRRSAQDRDGVVRRGELDLQPRKVDHRVHPLTLAFLPARVRSPILLGQQGDGVVRHAERRGSAEAPVEGVEQRRFHGQYLVDGVAHVADPRQDFGVYVGGGAVVGLLGGEEERRDANELIDGGISFGLGDHLAVLVADAANIVVLVLIVVVVVVVGGGHESIYVAHCHGDTFALQLEVINAVIEPFNNLGARFRCYRHLFRSAPRRRSR
mmetsp:Transcript_30065/g.64834  ORF Transcript_30065/g.64834 Transcript_30065/m.64834 type:complete len:258 (-) Transcript_30065:263-1036(-)